MGEMKKVETMIRTVSSILESPPYEAARPQIKIEGFRV